MKSKFKLSPAALFSIAGIIAAVMLISSYIELNQSRNEIYHLLYEHSSSLLESVIQSSSNTLKSSYEIEDIITERLLDNARAIKKLDSLNLLTRNSLIQFGKENNLYRINVFNKNGDRILTNRIPEPGHPHGEENINRYDELYPILENQTDELIIGLKTAEFTQDERFAVAVSRSQNRGAIVVNMDAANFLEFRKKIGIGVILQEISRHHGIEYIILQDTIGILAASEVIDSTESLNGSAFLESALYSDSVYSRITVQNDREVYEVTKRFILDGDLIGLYRLGVSLDGVRAVEDRMLLRLLLISLILAAIAIIVLSIIFTAQNLKTVSFEYKNFRTLTSSVLENMSEAVVVYDNNNIITLFNKSAENLFRVSSDDAIGSKLNSIQNGILSFLNKSGEKQVSLNGRDKYLSFSVSQMDDPELKKTVRITVIKDLTEEKKLEEEAKKNEKLSAMGELASGVAHEIRNPINSIGMIAQRLKKEYTPVSNQEEYSEITGLLKTEVTRINRIITQFLSYAKPLDMHPVSTSVKDLFDEIYLLFKDQALQKNISFSVVHGEPVKIVIDPDLIKQALMNIIQNAFDAADSRVTVEYCRIKDNLVVDVSDNGNGIPPEVQKKIFDLYYTTRKDGNGLGLSISQKIISQHSGSITVTSSENKGTSFRITLPLL